MKSEIERFAAEVKELIAQYREEVPGRRKQWPQAIRNRVKSLWNAGLTAKEISKLTELPYYTIYNWNKQSPQQGLHGRRSAQRKSGSFIPVQVQTTGQLNSTVTVPYRAEPKLQISSSTVTVTLPNGIRIEGVTAEFLQVWLGKGTGVGIAA